jgi:hypothetical protein
MFETTTENNLQAPAKEPPMADSRRGQKRKTIMPKETKLPPCGHVQIDRMPAKKVPRCSGFDDCVDSINTLRPPKDSGKLCAGFAVGWDKGFSVGYDSGYERASRPDEKLLYERIKVALPEALDAAGWIDAPGGMEWKHGGKKRVQELTEALRRQLKAQTQRRPS